MSQVSQTTMPIVQREWRSLIEPILRKNATDAPAVVELMLQDARRHRASDIHWRPENDAVSMHWRIDGVLQEIDRFSPELGPRVVARLKVLSQLLTYQTETPQEGRIREIPGLPETRVSTFPTLYGEKAVIRLFAGENNYRRLGDLGWPDEIASRVSGWLDQTGGAIILTGPAGSGKSTSLYACLRELVERSQGGRNLTTLEDPVEVVVPGVTQSQVNPNAGFSLVTGLRSLLRQDPDVIAVGEIRDQETAMTAYQAALSGHLMLTTFHAGRCSRAVARLTDLGLEPYVLKSGTLGVVCQRLARRLCVCQLSSDSASNCERCRGLGYQGRLLLAELMDLDQVEIGHAVIQRADANQLEQVARSSGMISLESRAEDAVKLGLTSAEEIYRVLGCTLG